MPGSSRQLHVYVVDDDPAVVNSTAFLVRTLGHDCVTFDSPEAMLAQIDALDPGCVLTDFRMPGMTGCDLASALRRRSVDWPMLLMSSENGTELDNAAHRHGFAKFLRKPLDSAELADALDRARAALAARCG